MTLDTFVKPVTKEIGVKSMDYLTNTVEGNIIKCYYNADALSISEGHVWYDCAHLTAKELAKEFGLTIWQTSLILSALSPRCSWDKNKTDAYMFLERIYSYKTTFPGLMQAPLNKCIKVYYDENLRKYRDSFYHEVSPFNVNSVLGKYSFKTKAFAAIIAEPENTLNYVCIDTHAINIAYGSVQDSKVVGKVFSNSHLYSLFSGCYNRAADLIGIPVAELQAITWCSWRRQLKKGVK